MSWLHPTFGKVGLLGVLIALAASGPAFAGWMGFRNDTKDTIVIQETIIVGGQPKPAKPQRLFVGEAVRDTQCNGKQRKISIYNLQNPNQLLYTGSFACPALSENVLYVIKSDGKGGVTIETTKSSAKAQEPPPQK